MSLLIGSLVLVLRIYTAPRIFPLNSGGPKAHGTLEIKLERSLSSLNPTRLKQTISITLKCELQGKEEKYSPDLSGEGVNSP